MSWGGIAQLLVGLQIFRNEDVKVELGKLGNVPFLRRYMKPGAEKLSPEDLGRRIDDGLVEYTWIHLPDAELGGIGIETFNSAMGEIQEGRSEHPALIAFKETLWSNEKVPLASETYLKLARRHIRCQTGQGTSFERRPPSPEEGRQFARALLGRNMEVAKWETDWDIRSFTRGQADKWLRKPDPYKLNELIIYSVKSAVAWDTLQLITKGLADSRLDRPDDLLHWNFEVATGLRKRPEEGSAPSHRRQKLGYKLRNNEFRRSVELLQAVGMTKTAGCKAAAEAVPYVISLSRVRSICQKGYCTVPELGEDAMVCLEPSFYSFLYGPDSNSGHTG